MSSLNPFLLAAATPDPDPRLLPLLRSQPSLASDQDQHGYSLLHAAASYDHLDLLRSLVNEFKVNVNLLDEDGETCLFVVETVDMAKCLVEELHADVDIRNLDGQLAVEKFEAEEEFPQVAAYLRLKEKGSATTNGVGHDQEAVEGETSTRPPRLPPNVRIDFNTSAEQDVYGANAQEPDPEFRRRIEELAASENFHTEEGQRELRDLITDAVRGVNTSERDTRPRMG